MKKLSMFLAAVALVAFTAGVSNAEDCLFNSPAKAKGIKASMVRAVASCVGSITYPGTNTTTSTGGTPGCTPPFYYSSYSFGPKGACSYSNKGKTEIPCSDGIEAECYNLTQSVKCKGIVDVDTVTPIDGAAATGWSLQSVTRPTVNDSAAGVAITIFDFPVQSVFPCTSGCGKGKLKFKGDTNTLLAGLGLPPLGVCSTLAPQTIVVSDPDGNQFAVLGGGGTGS